MALPKKHTRRLSVDGISYLWHLNKDWDLRDRSIVVQREGCEGGQLLMIDPYHHDFLPTRGAVGGAIRFALDRGWHPHQKGVSLLLKYIGKEHRFEFTKSKPKKSR